MNDERKVRLHSISVNAITFHSSSSDVITLLREYWPAKQTTTTIIPEALAAEMETNKNQSQLEFIRTIFDAIQPEKQNPGIISLKAMGKREEEEKRNTNKGEKKEKRTKKERKKEEEERMPLNYSSLSFYTETFLKTKGLATKNHPLLLSQLKKISKDNKSITFESFVAMMTGAGMRKK
jgi:hypothetical protein